MERTVIALGFFDGVHRGHGAQLQRTAERARELGAEPVVFTFDRPPKEVVTGQPVYLINSAEDRQGLIRRLYGIDRIILAPFDLEMMTMSWEDFVTELLVKRCGAVHLVAGHDHRFGHKNAGNAQLLREKCAQLGLGCDIIPEVVHDGITVSSTYIRKLVEGVGEHGYELDEYISKYAIGWKFQRIPRIAAAIMRVAMFEVLYMPEIPASAAINEAVELAKKYDEPKVASFVNGILGSFVRKELSSGGDQA